MTQCVTCQMLSSEGTVLLSRDPTWLDPASPDVPRNTARRRRDARHVNPARAPRSALIGLSRVASRRIPLISGAAAPALRLRTRDAPRAALPPAPRRADHGHAQQLRAWRLPSGRSSSECVGAHNAICDHGLQHGRVARDLRRKRRRDARTVNMAGVDEDTNSAAARVFVFITRGGFQRGQRCARTESCFLFCERDRDREKRQSARSGWIQKGIQYWSMGGSRCDPDWI